MSCGPRDAIMRASSCAALQVVKAWGEQIAYKSRGADAVTLWAFSPDKSSTTEESLLNTDTHVTTKKWKIPAIQTGFTFTPIPEDTFTDEDDVEWLVVAPVLTNNVSSLWELTAERRKARRVK